MYDTRGICREAVRELVDSGSPYLERSATLIKNTKIDFPILLGLQGRNITIGDLVAHLISLNSLSQIVGSFEQLVPDFKTHLVRVHERWTDHKESWPLPPIISDLQSTFAILEEMIRARHILTQEIPVEKPFNIGQIDPYFRATAEFVSGVDWLIVETLRDSIPKTQMAMNSVAADQMAQYQAILDGVIRDVRALDTINQKQFKVSQLAWESFAKEDASLHASLVEGGSMYPMVRSSRMAELIEIRTKDIVDFVNQAAKF